MTRTQKINKVKRMNDYIINEIGDEDLIYEWLTYGVMDCPTQADFEDFADDEDAFIELCELFERLLEEDEKNCWG